MPTYRSPEGSVGQFGRMLLFLIAGGLLALLLMAARLAPDARGWGTHQQLGLPPCTFRQLYAMRCPACGMTTAWSHFVRGEWSAALSCNAGGLLLAVAGAAATPWAVVTAVRGKWHWFRPTVRCALPACLTVLAVTLTDWLIKLAVEYFTWS